MNTLPTIEINEINDLLHKLLGLNLIKVLGQEFIGESILTTNIESSLKSLEKMSNDNFIKLYRILHFYYPRWIAYNVIKDSDDKYSDYSSNNELLLALTSIIDWLANSKGESMMWKKRFVNFLEINLLQEDIKEIIKDSYVYKNGVLASINNIDELAEYVYKVRSVVVHNADLTGIYPYNVSLEFNSEVTQVEKMSLMIRPEEFRRLLWKAILNSLNLNLIH